jgi:putative acetyltransferase
MEYIIREIESKDNKQVEHVIRTCLIEYGANHEGTAWADPDLGRFSEIYDKEAHKYWVAVDENDNVVAGVGIGDLPGAEGVCELQKMYCLKEYRGNGIASKLIKIAFDFAKQYYSKCYLETLENMIEAQRFYEKNGFVRLNGPLVNTGHFACDVCYLKELN